MPRTRFAVMLAAAGLVAASSMAGAAAPKPLLTDPAGDARVLGKGYDVVSATLYTTGTTKKVGKKSVYTPTALTAAITFAGPVSKTPGISVNFYADTSACGNGYFQWGYTPGSQFWGEGELFVSGCGTDNGVGPAMFVGDGPVVKGNVLSWRLTLKDMGKDLPLGTSFTNFRIYVDQNDPVLVVVGPSLLSGGGPDLSIDRATSAAVYRLK